MKKWITNKGYLPVYCCSLFPTCTCRSQATQLHMVSLALSYCFVACSLRLFDVKCAIELYAISALVIRFNTTDKVRTHSVAVCVCESHCVRRSGASLWAWKQAECLLKPCQPFSGWLQRNISHIASTCQKEPHTHTEQRRVAADQGLTPPPDPPLGSKMSSTFN